jgi:hypothetical protein
VFELRDISGIAFGRRAAFACVMAGSARSLKGRNRLETRIEERCDGTHPSLAYEVTRDG